MNPILGPLVFEEIGTVSKKDWTSRLSEKLTHAGATNGGMIIGSLAVYHEGSTGVLNRYCRWR